jgi:hypothetical protein
MITHRLKTWQKYMSDIATGKKSFDIRLDDRSYQVEDNLLLLGYDVEKKRIYRTRNYS